MRIGSKLTKLLGVLGLMGLIYLNSPSSANNNQLNIIYPPQTSTVNAKTVYIIGNAPPNSTLKINNTPIKQYDKGIFVATYPLKDGAKTFRVSTNTQTKTITVKAPASEKSLPAYPLQITNTNPSNNNVYRAGDTVDVKFKGSPGHNASFKIGNQGPFPMTETPAHLNNVKMYVLGSIYGRNTNAIEGIYTGSYKISKHDHFQQSPISIALKDSKGNVKSANTGGSVTTWNTSIPVVAEVLKEKTVARTGPGDARETPLPKGTLILLIGKDGQYYRFKKGPYKEGFISASDIRILPKGTQEPFSEIRHIDVKNIDNSTLISIPMEVKLPFDIDQAVDESVLSLYLYGAKADTDIIKYDANGSNIQQIKWSQPYTNVYKLDILFDKKQQWGYDVYYVGDKKVGTLKLVFKIKHPPIISKQNPLKDKIIAIDPGHGGAEKGSLGFGLKTEKEINLEISLKLAEILKKEGAIPILTRKTDKYMEIYDRPDLAATNDADLLLSIHNNAIPNGRNPLVERGTSTYYYHPMAFKLAESIQNNLLSDLNLPNFGLYYDNLALPREHRMPSVLVEIAFMINPQEYLLLEKSEFQQKAAYSITKGLKAFFLQRA